MVLPQVTTLNAGELKVQVCSTGNWAKGTPGRAGGVWKTCKKKNTRPDVSSILMGHYLYQGFKVVCVWIFTWCKNSQKHSIFLSNFDVRWFLVFTKRGCTFGFDCNYTFFLTESHWWELKGHSSFPSYSRQPYSPWSTLQGKQFL